MKLGQREGNVTLASCGLGFGACSQFLAEEGLKDKQLDSELIPVQKAVVQLAKSGEGW